MHREIIDSVIMKDRGTGHPRGFGFVTYSDPSVVNSVMHLTHTLDGRTVEISLEHYTLLIWSGRGGAAADHDSVVAMLRYVFFFIYSRHLLKLGGCIFFLLP